MPQPKKSLDESRVSFTKMTFSPDVPSTQLGPNEYNSGLNVEADVRGIRSVNGDEIILPSVPGTPTFVSGGFRQPIPGSENDFWFVVATDEGLWWANNGEGDWLDITNGAGPFTTYNQATNITEAWNGTVPFYNDEANPPQFWPEFDGISFPISTISGNGTTVTATFAPQSDEITGVEILDAEGRFSYTNGAPLRAGQKVTISGTNGNTTDCTIPNVEVAGLGGQFACDNFAQSSTFTASVAGTTLTVSAVGSGLILENQIIYSANIDYSEDIRIVSQLTGTPFGIGTYQLSATPANAPVASELMAGAKAAASATMRVGQSVRVSGTVSTSNQTLNNVRIISSDGDFSCNSAAITEGAKLTIAGTITNTTQTLSSISINGVLGGFTCAAANLYVGQHVTVSGTITNTPSTLTSVACVGGAGEFQCAATTLQTGQVVKISGTKPSAPTVLTGVAITGTAGQFSCSASTLYVGQIMEISGTYGGTGSITDYSNPTIYKISATNGTTTFTLVNLDGSALTTTAGTPTGLTYTIAPQSISKWSDPTSYVITATNGTTTFTLENLNLTPIVTTGGDTTGFVFEVQVPQINSYENPTTYQIASTNGSTTFVLDTLDGVRVSTQGGIPTGLTFSVLPPSITGYANPTTYFVSATNGSNRFTLKTINVVDGVEVPGVAIETQGGLPTGLTYTLLAGSISGYSDPTTYYIGATNGNTAFTLVDSAGDPIVTTGGATTGLTFQVLAPNISGYSNPTTYYVITTNGVNQFQLSATYNGSPITTQAGAPSGLVYVYSPFAIGQEITVRATVPVAYRGTYTVTNVSGSSVSWASATQGTQQVAGYVADTMPLMIMYSNTLPISLYEVVYESPTEQRAIFGSTQLSAPYSAGDYILIRNTQQQSFDGEYLVTACDQDSVTYRASPVSNWNTAFNSTGTVSPRYAWNYNPNWKSVYAKWMRMYNTPNVGNILVAGGLTATDLDNTVFEYPTTVQWSQAFGLNQAPLTWEPTITNVANQVDMPLRGQALDGFPFNGQFYISSYWDTGVLSPINYATTSAPILGVRLFNQGRGILSSNCWTNADSVVYGLDARDIWVFDGNSFTGIGNQRVKNWFYNQIDQNYVDRIFMDNNNSKNQVEIYYPTKPPVISSIVITDTAGTFTCNPLLNAGGPLRVGLEVVLSGTETGSGSISGYNPAGSTYYVIYTNGIDEFQLSATPTGSPITTTAGSVTGVNFQFISDGVPNMMLAYRYDIDCWNAPREVQGATMTCEAPFWNTDTWYYAVSGTTLTGSGTGAKFNIQNRINKYGGYPTPNVRGSGYAVGNTIRILGTALGGETPANDCIVTVDSVTTGGAISTFSCTGTALNTWKYDAGRRNIVYARGLLDRNLVIKDEGYNFLGPVTEEYPVNSQFRRDNIRVLPDYSGKLLVHRILPEVVNLNKYNLPINPIEEPDRIGTVDIKVEGANSVGQPPQETTALSMSTDTDYPWVQMNQNAHRVNSIEISHSSTNTIWMCSATTWQYTQTEDDR